jgi:hypothetical protein
MWAFGTAWWRGLNVYLWLQQNEAEELQEAVADEEQEGF